MKGALRSALLLCLAGTTAAQTSSVMVGEQASRVSAHVWAIIGYPNIGIVVGTRAVLVVDTGLGPRNGATAARIARGLAPTQRMYLTTTHFHPEHSAGEAGFPPGTTLIRNRVQQQEMDAHFEEMRALFASRSPEQQALLSGVVVRPPDVLYDAQYRLDLGGGVSARLLWFGAAHSRGDELIFVEPDRTLISGDVVQNQVAPNIYGEGGTPSSWLAVLKRIAPLHARQVLPDHSAVGQGSLVAQEQAFIADLRTRALALKRGGTSAEDAGRILGGEFQSRYAGWRLNSVPAFVARIYAEAP